MLTSGHLWSGRLAAASSLPLMLTTCLLECLHDASGTQCLQIALIDVVSWVARLARWKWLNGCLSALGYKSYSQITKCHLCGQWIMVLVWMEVLIAAVNTLLGLYKHFICSCL